ncbi:MAG: hypothetical protein QW429_06910 [Thermoprotei archaeon]
MSDGSGTNLALLGSPIPMMEDGAPPYSSPLYGGRTIGELRFAALRFYGSRVVDAIGMYGFAGGVPHHLSKVGSPLYTWSNTEWGRLTPHKGGVGSHIKIRVL